MYEYAIFVISNDYRVKYFIYTLFSFLLILTACQPDITNGNVIVFVDVIGPYIGECANYQDSTGELENREESTLSVFAVNTNEAGDGSTVILTYYSERDSIVLTQSGAGMDNFIFAGLRE